MTNNFAIHQLLRGDIVTAEYKEQDIEMYRDNPLIDALPSILSASKFIELATRLPDFNVNQRLYADEVRMHLIPTPLFCFQPLSRHVDLERKISCMIRMGYTTRNPCTALFRKTFDERVNGISKGVTSKYTSFGTSSLGFFIVGTSGIGKTVAVETILSLYPQVIVHNHYQNASFPFMQVVWLKLECPHDGSLNSLCNHFFLALDDMLETHYWHSYTRNGRATTEMMLPHIGRLCLLHGIGIIVIDEIQNLNEAKSGGAARMLNFFVQLINSVRTPVILVGTPKAKNILGEEFRQIRRGAGQGDFIWNVMNEDEEWQLLVETIWPYQYLREYSPLTKEISHELYYQSLGIIDIAVKLYMLTQARCIDFRNQNGHERITVETIRETAIYDMSKVQQALDIVRHRDISQLKSFPDLEPLEINFTFDPVSKLAESSQLEETDLGIDSTEPEITTRSEDDRNAQTSPSKPKRRKQSDASQGGTLTGLYSEAKKAQVNVDDALREANHMRPVNEFLPNDQ